MRFYETLEKYINACGSSNKEISELSGISAETISCYRRGVREPYPESKSLSKLAYGIFRAFRICGTEISEEEILSELSSSLYRSTETDAEGLSNNLRLLMESCDITNNELARNICFDPSYISRILSGKRKPSDINKFITDTASFIASKAENGENLSAIAGVMECKTQEITDWDMRIRKIISFLSSRKEYDPINFGSILEKMDEFDLEEYSRTMKFDDSFSLPAVSIPGGHKNYCGPNEIKKSELDFLSLTLASDSKESVITYTDISINEAMSDKNYMRSWINGMSMLLRKGLDLKIIHDMSRTTYEMMLGIETYIPMYMTGRITPYYFVTSQSDAFHHILRVSGAAAVAGGAIEGFPDSSHCRISTEKNEIRFFRKTGEQLLSIARPLMEIYRKDRLREFSKLLNDCFEMPGTRRIYLSAPPFFTIPDEVLESILKRNNADETKKKQIRNYLESFRKKIDPVLVNELSYFQFSIFSRDEFAIHPVSVIIPEIFYEDNLYYTYEEYLAHIRSTALYLKKYPNAQLYTSARQAFRNIVISVIGNEFAVISKSRRPSVHFILRHPRLIDAINSFYLSESDEYDE